MGCYQGLSWNARFYRDRYREAFDSLRHRSQGLYVKSVGALEGQYEEDFTDTRNEVLIALSKEA